MFEKIAGPRGGARGGLRGRSGSRATTARASATSKRAGSVATPEGRARRIEDGGRERKGRVEVARRGEEERRQGRGEREGSAGRGGALRRCAQGVPDVLGRRPPLQDRCQGRARLPERRRDHGR